MEHWFTNNIAVFDGPVKPRTVQTLAIHGVTCAVFTDADAAPGAAQFKNLAEWKGKTVIGITIG